MVVFQVIKEIISVIFLPLVKFFLGLVPGVYTRARGYYFILKFGLTTIFKYIKEQPLMLLYLLCPGVNGNRSQSMCLLCLRFSHKWFAYCDRQNSKMPPVDSYFV